MKNQRKTLKRIFALFVAILCTFGVFFVSYIDSLAEDVTWSVTFNCSSYSNGSSNFGLAYKAPGDSSWTFIKNDTTHGGFGSINISVPMGNGYIYRVYTRNSKRTGSGIPYTYYYYLETTYSLNGGSTSSFSSSVDNPTVLSYPSVFNFVFYNVGSQTTSSTVVYGYFTFDSIPTPTPTPTSAPATPTPNPYGPGPVPTIPPGEQSYTDFFTRLASDAQSAFNAIFLSWNNANSRFYSGIFFIGFPILLGIIGLVASIFFGDDD